jgi:hypothetical protein
MDVLPWLVVFAFAGVALLGWLIPLIIGIVHMRRRTGGLALIIVGAIWGFGAIAVGGLGALAYREFSRATRFEYFDPSAYHGAMGAIVVPNPGELIVRDKKLDRRLCLQINRGIARAPVGRYDVVSWTEAVAPYAPAGSEDWTASCEFDAGPSSELVVTAEGTQRLEVGPPFTVSVDVAPQAGGRVTLILKVMGLGGHSYSIVSRRRPPPRFEVLDGSRKVVWHGNFEYG